MVDPAQTSYTYMPVYLICPDSLSLCPWVIELCFGCSLRPSAKHQTSNILQFRVHACMSSDVAFQTPKPHMHFWGSCIQWGRRAAGGAPSQGQVTKVKLRTMGPAAARLFCFLGLLAFSGPGATKVPGGQNFQLDFQLSELQNSAGGAWNLRKACHLYSELLAY